MRDQRFIAAHRGGPLDRERHRLLATWAADCADRLLPLIEKHSDDPSPRRAIETARAWVRGDVKTGAAQKAAVACHAVARGLRDPAAVAAARAIGHAVATAHFADHCLGIPLYGLKAIEATGGSVETERAWQLAHLPAEVRELVTSALENRLAGKRASSPAPKIHTASPTPVREFQKIP